MDFTLNLFNLVQPLASKGLKEEESKEDDDLPLLGVNRSTSAPTQKSPEKPKSKEELSL